MVINYAIASKDNLDAPNKFYAQAMSSGELTLRKLGKEIAESFACLNLDFNKVNLIPMINKIKVIMRILIKSWFKTNMRLKTKTQYDIEK